MSDDQGYYERQDIRRDLDSLRREVWELQAELKKERARRAALEQRVCRIDATIPP